MKKELGYSSQIKSLEECAKACDGFSVMFAFGTNDFGGGGCDDNGNCKCLCETSVKWHADTCSQTDNMGYRLYIYSTTGTKII